jgi:hypothetical protein
VVIGIFVVVLAIVLGVAAFAMHQATPPAPQPRCPKPPCVAPPKPPPPPPEAPLAPALVAGTLFHGKLGYRFEYSKDSFQVKAKDPSLVELSPAYLNALVFLNAYEPSAGSPKQLVDERVANMPFNVVGLANDTKLADRILGPAVGYRSGYARQLVGTLDTPQGPGPKIQIVVMGATDGKVTVVESIATTYDDRKYLFNVLGELMNTFRFPSEVPK